MKKYRLKQWYPSLQKKTIEGNIANWDADEKAYTVIQNGDRVEILDKTEVENNPDFWDLIEERKPLFVTEDGLECFDGDEYYSIGVDFKAIRMRALEHGISYSSDVKRFKHESNADEYIVKNKPVFSYEDFIRWGNVPYERVIMKLAKERIEG